MSNILDNVTCRKEKEGREYLRQVWKKRIVQDSHDNTSLRNFILKPRSEIFFRASKIYYFLTIHREILDIISDNLIYVTSTRKKV